MPVQLLNLLGMIVMRYPELKADVQALTSKAGVSPEKWAATLKKLEKHSADYFDQHISPGPGELPGDTSGIGAAPGTDYTTLNFPSLADAQAARSAMPMPFKAYPIFDHGDGNFSVWPNAGPAPGTRVDEGGE